MPAHVNTVGIVKTVTNTCEKLEKVVFENIFVIAFCVCFVLS